MPRSVIEYFAALGRNEEHLDPKPIKAINDEDVDCSVSDLWMDAITEIGVLLPQHGEKLPNDTWAYVTDLNDNPINCNIYDHSKPEVFLVYQRRRHNSRFDHISQIKLGIKFDDIPHGYNVLIASLGGIRINNAFNTHDFNTPMISIFVKRSEYTPRKPFFGDPFIDSLLIYVKTSGTKDTLPEGFVTIARSLNSPMFSPKAYLSYRLRRPLGMCDIAFQAVAHDRYPIQDYAGLALPVNELHHFTFPHGLRLRYDRKENYPLPNIFTFVFTDGNGKHLYVAALQFYETLPEEIIAKFFADIYNMDFHGAWGVQNQNCTLFSPKVICVISQKPFYRAMRRFLRQIYSLSLSPAHARQPLERFIASVVGQIPQPVPGGRPFFVSLDAGLVGSTFAAMSPLRFELPPLDFFPPLDLDFTGPLRVMSVENLLGVFALLLQEAKIVFLCSSNALLTEVMETLRALLFPLSWSFCFVPRLPDAFSAVLEAPGGFMVGLHMPKDDGPGAGGPMNSNETRRSSGDVLYTRQGDWMQSLQAGTYVVDLSEDKISICEAIKKHPYRLLKPVRARQQLVELLPVSPRSRLSSQLLTLSQQYSLGPLHNIGGLERFDNAFEQVDLLTESSTGLDLGPFPTLHLRDAFMVFMAEILGNYWAYITPPKALTKTGFCSSASSFTTLEEEFRIEEYIVHSPEEIRPLLKHLVSTQMFAVLLQTRSEELSRPLVFFERASHLMRDAELLASPPRSNGKRNYSTVVSQLPISLYKMLLSTDGVDGPHETATQNDDEWWDELSLKRNELQNTMSISDLQLANPTMGPLVLCGPHISDFLEPAEDSGHANAEMEALNRSMSGSEAAGFEWGRLDSKLLLHAEQAAKARLAALRAYCSTSRATSAEGIELLSRSPSEFCLTPERQKKLQQSPIGTIFQLESISCSLLMTSLQIMYCPSRPCLDALQVLGFISLLGTSACGLLDVCIWRAILTAFSSRNEELLRYASCSLFEYLVNAGVPLDSLSAAVYSRKVTSMSKTADCNLSARSSRVDSAQDHSEPPESAVAQNSSSFTKTTFDNFQYLEEIGLCFLSEMTMLPESDGYHDSPTTTRSNSPSQRSESSSSYDLSNRKRSCANEKSFVRYRKEMKIRCSNATRAVQLASSKLGLVRGLNELYISHIPKDDTVGGPTAYRLHTCDKQASIPLDISLGLFEEALAVQRLQLSQNLSLLSSPDLSSLQVTPKSNRNRKSSNPHERIPDFPDTCRRGWIKLGVCEYKEVPSKKSKSTIQTNHNNNRVRVRIRLQSYSHAVRCTSILPSSSHGNSTGGEICDDKNLNIEEFTLFSRDFQCDEIILEVIRADEIKDDLRRNSYPIRKSRVADEELIGILRISLMSIMYSEYDVWLKAFSTAPGSLCVGMVRLKLSILEAKASDDEVKELCLGEGDIIGPVSETATRSSSISSNSSISNSNSEKDTATSNAFEKGRSQSLQALSQLDEVDDQYQYQESRVRSMSLSVSPARGREISQNADKKHSSRPRSNSVTRIMSRMFRNSNSDSKAENVSEAFGALEVNVNSGSGHMSLCRTRLRTHQGDALNSAGNENSSSPVVDVVRKLDVNFPLQRLSDGVACDSATVLSMLDAVEASISFFGQSDTFISHPKLTSNTIGETKSVDDNVDKKSLQLATDVGHADANLVSRVHDILQYNQKRMRYSSSEVIAIHSLTPCYCGELLSDEEVTWTWLNGSTPKKRGPRDRSFSSVLSAIASDSRIICQSCKAEFAPELHIRCYQRAASHDSISSPTLATGLSDISLQSDSECRTVSVWRDDVPMMRPSALRAALEKEVLVSGEKVCDASWLRMTRPELYWNHLWYCTRFNLLPGIGLSTGNDKNSTGNVSSSSCTQCVVIGWQESCVKAKAEYILWRQFHLSKSSLSDRLESLSDLRPMSMSASASASESVSIPLSVAGPIIRAYLNPVAEMSFSDISDLLTTMASHLDGSVIGLRRAVRHLFSLVAPGEAPEANYSLSSWPISKRLYYALAAITHMLGQSTCITVFPASSNSDQRQVVFLDALYIRMVMTQITADDLTQMNDLTKEELIKAVPQDSIGRLRDTFGYIL